jgi:WS/DGAT/MGAT family acyltransferase
MTGFADPLSMLDTLFLAAEHEHAPMHIGATLVFEKGPLATDDGSLDVGRLRDHVAARLDRAPRFRQRLARTPLEGRMLWIDDDRFDLEAHVRYRRIAHRASERDWKEAIAKLLAQPLDLDRPPWELWIVEGAGTDEFTIVVKMHHCMADGAGGLAQLCMLLDVTAEHRTEPIGPWTPRPVPGPLDLFVDDLSASARRAVAAVALALAPLCAPRESWNAVRDGAASIAETTSMLLRPARATSFNRAIGGQRRFEWLAMSLAEVQTVQQHFGVTLNDVVLATVSGALRRYLSRHGDNGGGELRAAVPVSMRDGTSSLGNQVSFWLLPLPVAEKDPAKRIAAVHSATMRRKRAAHAQGIYSLLRLAEGATPAALDAGVRVLEHLRPFNLLVTNVPGPQFPLYLNGARLLAAYPSVPLFEAQGLGVALLSYHGRLHWGFLGDPSAVPDLEEFVYVIAVSFCELLERASETREPASQRGSRATRRRAA